MVFNILLQGPELTNIKPKIKEIDKIINDPNMNSIEALIQSIEYNLLYLDGRVVEKIHALKSIKNKPESNNQDVKEGAKLQQTLNEFRCRVDALWLEYQRGVRLRDKTYLIGIEKEAMIVLKEI